MGVSVGGTAVSVGGKGVSVGGNGVSVGTGVSVGSGVSVGTGVHVGMGVSVGSGGLVRVGTEGEMTSDGRWVRVGSFGVNVGRTAVFEACGARVGVLVGMAVSVGTKAVTACSVSAAAVFRLLAARSMMLSGSSVTWTMLFRSLIAIAETLHNKLNPITPAVRTPRGPAYALILTLVALLIRFDYIKEASCRLRCPLLVHDFRVQTDSLSHILMINSLADCILM
jgi:hypothetical protein